MRARGHRGSARRTRGGAESSEGHGDARAHLDRVLGAQAQQQVCECSRVFGSIGEAAELELRDGYGHDGGLVGGWVSESDERERERTILQNVAQHVDDLQLDRGGEQVAEGREVADGMHLASIGGDQRHVGDEP